jgi:hypothetical protein
MTEDRGGQGRTGEDRRGLERTGEDWRGLEMISEDRRGQKTQHRHPSAHTRSRSHLSRLQLPQCLP